MVLIQTITVGATTGVRTAMKLRVLSARAVYALQVAVRMASVDLGKIVMRAVHAPMEAVRKGMLEGMVALGNTV